MKSKSASDQNSTPKYPGVLEAMDGTEALVSMETAGSEAAGAYPITPATQMGEGWALAAAQGRPNVFGRQLLFFEPEGEHAAAGVTAGMSLVGLRAANFSAAQGIAYMHESLYAAVGKRLTYVLNMACRAMTKQALNIHCGHDDYHAVDDTGFFQLFAKDVQEAADLNLIAHRTAELALTPGICAQDGFLTSHVIETLLLPERELVKEFLGDPADMIETPTPAQRMVFGPKRRRIPELFDLDHPAMIGTVQNQDAYAQGVAAQRPFFFDHVQQLVDQAFEEFGALTGRHYARAMGYRTDDAEYLIVGQGSIVPNVEAVADYYRDKRKIKVGVVNLTMFRPFPSDILTRLLQGKKGAVVLERVDQPLSSDAPILREIRTAMVKGLENGRAKKGDMPHPGVTPLKPADVPEFYSCCYGLGSRDVQPGHLIAAVENMLPDGLGKRQFYLGIDFVRQASEIPGVGRLQSEALEYYPHLKDLALPPEKNVNLLPEDALPVRIHSVGGWGAITMGKNLTMTLFSLLGMHVKSNPKYGSEKKGQPTTFYATFSHDPIRLNCDLSFVDVVLSPDPNVFKHSNPLAGLIKGGVFVIQTDRDAQGFWERLPEWARRTIRDREIRVFILDAFGIAHEEASNPALQYRMQGNAFQGAFFKASPLMKRENLSEDRLFDAIRDQLQKKFGGRGQHIVEDNFRVIRRGFDEIQELDLATLKDVSEVVEQGTSVWKPAPHETQAGVGDPKRFFDQVFSGYNIGEDPIADPFGAISAIPASTGALRDMTGIRFDVPNFVPEKCTGCAQCWTQCPDSAIPGVVTPIDALLRSAASLTAKGNLQQELLPLIDELAEETRAVLKSTEFSSFGTSLSQAYDQLTSKLDWDADRRAKLDAEFAPVLARLKSFPLAKTGPFFVGPEGREAGTGGMLSVTINPYACKGCMLCVEVCPDKALEIIKQDEDVVDQLRRNWEFWQRLPETPDRYVQVRNLEEGIGVLQTILLKKAFYQSMVGGDGSCMGCGEKTTMHLILTALEAAMQPRVRHFVEKVEGLISKLDGQARLILAADANLEQMADAAVTRVDLTLSEEKRTRFHALTELLKKLKDLHWRYTTGPTGRGRASLGMTNATGCSSVWASTYPYNPYPFPWTNHLFQDAPSIAIGIFDGHMRKMADGFKAVRRAELEVEGTYDPAVHDAIFSRFDFHDFTDEEFRLCPPIFAVGGDGAMFDIGFQNLSRLLASDKPVRAIVLDTQVYSNTGGQACSSGFLGQVSDMAAWGGAQHGKLEQRKELSLISLAHRNCFVLQTSQASASHLIAGVLKGLNSRRPAVFNLYSPCQTEHGIADDASFRAAKLALESRAVPFLLYDPDAGDLISQRLNLDGNPAVDEPWPTYELTYLDDADQERTMTLPVTIADWAITEGRFGKHFKKIKGNGAEPVLLHEYLDMSADERAEKTPFIYVQNKSRHLERYSVSKELVELTRERQTYWIELKELAGIHVGEEARERIVDELDDAFNAKMEALKEEYEAKMEALKASYPQIIATRLAQVLVQSGGDLDLSQAALPAAPALPPAPAPATAPKPTAEKPKPAAAEEEEEEGFGVEPYVKSELCTSCDECININPKMFAYDENKKAYIKDPDAGTFRQLVEAAEKCSGMAVVPGTPRNPKEKDLNKWVKRAEPFQDQ